MIYGAVGAAQKVQSKHTHESLSQIEIGYIGLHNFKKFPFGDLFYSHNEWRKTGTQNLYTSFGPL